MNIKKFKLIKEYPGSPSLGTITEVDLADILIGYNVGNWEEFWEEIIELCVPLGTKFKVYGIIYTLERILENTNLIVISNLNVEISASAVYKISEVNERFKSGMWVEYKEPIPLFVTEEGIWIFEGDEYYFVDKELYSIHGPRNTKDNYWHAEHHRYFLYFSTYETAQEWVIYNKPCLSIKDINDNWIINFELAYKYTHINNTLNNLKKIVKQRI